MKPDSISEEALSLITAGGALLSALVLVASVATPYLF